MNTNQSSLEALEHSCRFIKENRLCDGVQWGDDACTNCSINRACLFLRLPNKVEIDIEELTDRYDCDIDEIEDKVVDYLSDEFGFCICCLDIYIDEDEGIVKATNIEWDTTD